jgi:hypothetical protein
MVDRDPGAESPRKPSASGEHSKTSFEAVNLASGIGLTGDGAVFPLGQILGILAPLLLAAGIVIYGILGLGYDQFYGRLGIDPAAVGLNYGTVLSHATGFVAVVLISVSAGVVVLISGWRRRGRSNSSWMALGLILSLFLLYVPYLFIVSRNSADAVANGRPVAPIASLGLTELAVHADPVTIEATGKAGEVTAIDRLVGRTDLLYMGQGNGIVVLYDPSTQSALYLPSSSILMKVSNCATKRSPDPRCNRRYQKWQVGASSFSPSVPPPG